MLKKQKNKKQTRTSRPSPSLGQFQRNSLVVSRGQRETESHKQSVAQRQTDYRRARSRQLRVRRISALSLVVVIIGLMYGLSVRSVDVRATKSSARRTGAYTPMVEQYLASKVALRQSWLIDDAQLLLYLQDTHPEIKSVATRTPSLVGGTLEVELGFRMPEYVWRSAAGSRYIDDEGVLFSKNVFDNVDIASLPVIEDQGSAGFSDGSAVLPAYVARDIAYIYDTVPTVFGESQEITSVVLPPRARAIYAQVDGLPYTIKFSTERGIEDQVKELKELTTYFSSANIQPGEYVDVRVENKAFYR